MMMTKLLKAFALFAVTILLVSSLAMAIETDLIVRDGQGRVDRLERAVAAVSRGEAGAVAEARAALADAPPAVRSSPALRDLEGMLATLDHPLVGQLMAPLLASGLLDLSSEELAARAEEIQARLESIGREIGIDTEVLAPQWQALLASADGLDMADPATLEEQLRALPEEKLQALTANLAGFTAAWNQTAGTDLARRMDEIAQAVLARPSVDIFGGGELDPETFARYEETMHILDEIRESLDPETIFGLEGSGTYDAEAWAEYKSGLKFNVTEMFAAMGAMDDAFLGDPLATEPSFPREPAGLVAVDGIPTPGVPAPVPAVPALPAPAPGLAAALPVDLAALQAPIAPLRPTGVPVAGHAETASDLGLPGARGVGFPTNAYNAASPAERTDAPDNETDATTLLLPDLEDYRGTLGPQDTRDVYLARFSENTLVRIFLEVPENTNADLKLVCRSNNVEWKSASDSSSDRPYFDSITFVLNAAGSATNEAFTPTSDPTGSRCPGGEFYLHVYAPASEPPTGEITYLLRGSNEWYQAYPCTAASWDICGLNWARWGDRCKDTDTDCQGQHPSVGNNRNYTTQLSANAQQPVVFIHGVGDLGYNTFVDMESHSYRKGFSMDGVIKKKAIVTLVGSAIVGFGTASFVMCAQSIALFFAAGPSLVGALIAITMLTMAMASWSMLIMGVFKVLATVMVYWRNDSWDEDSHFWNVRRAGFETYWIEYNAGDNHAIEARKHIQRAGWQIKFGISAIQQEFFDRHHKDPGFPYASPEDVKVDLVVHSMGGLTSRFYTSVPGVTSKGDYAANVREGHSFASNLYEADVNKWISIQTPNMGSSVAKALYPQMKISIGVGDLLMLIVGIAISACFGLRGPSWIPYLKMLVIFAAKEIAFPLYVHHDLIKRDQLIPGQTPVVDYINSLAPAADIDHGIIYGLAFPGILLDIKRFDMLVAENDALGPPQLKARMASWPVPDDHASALFSGPTRDKLHQWLRNPDATPLPGEAGALASAEGFAPEDAGLVLAAANPPGRSLFETFGQVTGASADTEAGAKYTPDGGALSTPAPVRTVENLGGDRAMKLQRLAAERGFSDEARSFADADAATRDALAQANADPENTSAIVAQRTADASSDARAAGPRKDLNELAPDIGILRAGHSRDAHALLEAIAEPSVFISASAPESQFLQRDILLVPTGALSGADARLGETLARFASAGGTVIALAQPRGSDLSLLPGAPEGFGYTEEDGAYRDSVVFGTFTPALAGQSDASPDLSVDGSFTTLPEGATILLRSAKNARAVVASYPYGDGRVVASTLLSDWARASGRGTSADTILLRDLIADARAPAATSLGAPGAAFTLSVDLGALAAGADAATLVLVDDGARETARATFSLSGGNALTWEVPVNTSTARHFHVDAILRDANGTPLDKVLGVEELYAAHFAANPDGFRPSFAPAALDVTSTSDRVENGASFGFDLRVTNLQETDADLVVGYWFPEHATLTGDLAGHGAGAPREGAAAAWADNFLLRENVTVPAGEAVEIHQTLPEVLRSDAVTARLYAASDMTLLGEARRAFTAYVPTVQVNLSTNAAHYAGGDEIQLTVTARDTAAAADAGSRPADITATLRDPAGILITASTTSVLIGPSEHSAVVGLALPPDAAVGTYLLSVETRLGAQRVGSATLTTRVPGAQLAALVTLPVSFTAGAPASVTYALSDPGSQPIVDATFTTRLYAPDGSVEWSDAIPLSLAAGASQDATFHVAPTTVTPGTYRLAYSALIDGIEFAGETPLRAGASATIALSQSSFRARDPLAADIRIVNDGRFVLPLSISALAAGIDATAATPTLLPGETTTLTLVGTVPENVTSGAHSIEVVMSTPDGARTVTRSFTVPPARLALTMPATTSAPAGSTLSATLGNTGGVDALAPWAARLVDQNGRVIAVASAEALVIAGGTSEVGIAVPPQARTGTYAFTLSADTGGARATTRSMNVDILGVSGTVSLGAPASVAPGATIALAATPTATGASLVDASIEFTAIRPTPLPAWVPIAGASGQDIIEHGGARWVARNTGLLRVDSATGAVTTITTADGLPSDRITALAVARGMLHVGTDRGIAWWDGGAWNARESLGPLPTKSVRALAGSADELFIATDVGMARFDGTTVSSMLIPAPAARALATNDDELWVALADVSTGFVGIDAKPITKTGTLSANPSIAVAPDGDVHVIYADNLTGSANARLLHVHLSADGALISGPHVVRNASERVALTGLTVDSSGDLHAVWEDYRTANDADVYYRKISPNGALLSEEIAIGQHGGSSQRWARIVTGPNDVIYAAWADDRDPNPPSAMTSRGSEIYFAKMNKDGTVLLPQTRLTFSTGNVLIPRIAVDTQGNIHATYTDRVKRCDPQFPSICWDNLEAFYQKWDANGVQLVAPLIVSREDDTISYLPGIGLEAGGRASIVYQELGQGGGMRLARVGAAGQLLASHVLLTSTSVVRPQLAPRADGLLDVIWTDYHSGKSEAWHNILDPLAERLTLAQPERINAAPAANDAMQVVNGFALSVATSTAGRTYAAWDDQRNAAQPEWRVASTATRFSGSGVARIDLTTGQSTTISAADGALPSNDVLGIALEGDLAAFVTPGAVSIRDARTGGIDTLTAADVTGPIALHAGRAFIATSARGLVADPQTRQVHALDAGGPLTTALSATPAGLLVVGPNSAALLRDDREDRFGTIRINASDGVPTLGQIAAPLEQGRYRVRATLLAQTEQTLAVAERDVHVVEGELAVTISPAKTLVTVGERIDIIVSVGNRGTTDLRAVRATLAGPAGLVIDQSVDLRAGEARTFIASIAAGASYDLRASASGFPATAAGTTARLTSSATDHVRVVSPTLTARILAPDVASRAPFTVDARLTNPGPLPLAVSVALEGGATRQVTVPAAGTALVEGLATMALSDDTTLRLTVSGAARASAEHLVIAGDRTLLASTSGLAGAAGARVISLTFQNTGSLASAFPLAIALDGTALEGTELGAARSGSLSHDITLELAAGIHELSYETPWESGTLRLVASDAAVPLLSVEATRVSGGQVVADVRLENAGPGRLLGTLEVDLGPRVESFELDLAEGETFAASPTASLAGVAPGIARVVATALRDGANAAQTERAYVVPGPLLRFVSIPADLAVDAGESLALVYEVENIGEATGPATVTVTVGGGDAVSRQVQLAPGERTTLSFGSRVEPDARDGLLAVVARAPGANATSALRVTGARISATAATDAPRYAPGETALLALNVTNLAGAAVDLTLRATLGADSPEQTLQLAPGATALVELSLTASVTGDAPWTIALASGRVLAQGAARIVLDTLGSSGVRVETNVDEVPAGGLVNVTFTTSVSGRFDLVGPGIRDAFTLNGTQTRTYLIPANTRAERYTMLYNFDATNATGTIPLAVSGQEVDSLLLRLSDAGGAPLSIAGEGQLVRASWTVRSALAGPAVVHAWLVDAAGASASAVTYEVALAAGANTIELDLLVAGLDAGTARAFLTLELPDAPSGDTLAQASAAFDVRGFALRDARIERGEGLAYALHVQMAAVPNAAAALSVTIAGTPAHAEKVNVNGVVDRVIAFEAPEPGSYHVLLNVTANGASQIRSLIASIPGTGTPPVTTLAIDGPSWERADGVLVIAPTTRILVDATDDASGVAATYIIDGEGSALGSDGRLPPGFHNLTYYSTDKAGHEELHRTLALLVEGDAPTLTLTHPTPGEVHIAGQLVARPPTVALALPLDLLPALPPDVLDTDGDGFTDAEETLDGSDVNDSRSTPARYMPAPPPTLERPVIAIGALSIVASAADEGAGVARIWALLDGRLVSSADTDAIDRVLDLSEEAPGDHEVTILTEDRLGNTRAVSMRVQLLPSSAEGARMADATAPRVHPFVPAVADWLASVSAELPDVLAQDAARREARIDAEATRADREVVQPLTPTAVSELPGQIERDLDAIRKAVDDLVACCAGA